MIVSRWLVEQADAILPQTQCGLCGYEGCMPYAEAMVYDNAPINRCPPGGSPTLTALGALFNQTITAELQAGLQEKPATVAVIRENECIGCTKCIQACPVDAIIGSAKQMHTVIAIECTGCDLCVPACPVDCIDMVATKNSGITPDQVKQSRKRFYAKKTRTIKEKRNSIKNIKSTEERKKYIVDAIRRMEKNK
ncbi:MAG TPA: RnfABCDGE type electron transport complex subunit B [Gammaproteobacteria bacterium]|jgi:electron transport complex protein RnfB|nr:RnfABCDGE type electron transport complex subunit B [Gammaproteobacteria bacterium]